jgi:hypothetical protein
LSVSSRFPEGGSRTARKVVVREFQISASLILPEASQCAGVGTTAVQLPGGLAAPEADRYVNAPAPDATAFEPANRNPLFTSLTSSDVTQGRQVPRKVHRKPGEPVSENLDRNFVWDIKVHSAARDARDGTPVGLVGESAYFHELASEVISRLFWDVVISLPVATTQSLAQADKRGKDVEKKSTCLIDGDSP